MSDDGEPAGTAGRPVLAVVRGSGLGDLCVVVTRFFGGTLLGTGGLVRAYGDAAKAVIAALERTEKVEQRPFRVVVSYSQYESIKLLIGEQQGLVIDETFAGDVTVVGQLPADHAHAFAEAVRDRTNGRVAVQFAQALPQPSTDQRASSAGKRT